MSLKLADFDALLQKYQVEKRLRELEKSVYTMLNSNEIYPAAEKKRPPYDKQDEVIAKDYNPTPDEPMDVDVKIPDYDNLEDAFEWFKLNKSAIKPNKEFLDRLSQFNIWLGSSM